MKILLTGGNGQIASSIKTQAQNSTHKIFALPHSTLDITQPAAIIAAMKQYSPDIVINTAAYTAVDQAEQEPQRAMQINATGATHLAEACALSQVPLIHLSTDYVFAGNQTNPYTETDTPAPLNLYGLSKLKGEEAIHRLCTKHLILRVSSVFGLVGHNFVKTILRLAQQQEAPLSVVADQISCPTSADDIAQTVLNLAAAIATRPAPTIPWGIYHYCSGEPVSWHTFASVILALTSQRHPLRVKAIQALASADYPRPARRPACSILACAKIQQHFGITQPNWRTALAALLPRLLPSPETT